MQHDCQFAIYSSGNNVQTFKAPSYLGDGHKCFLAPQANGQLIVYQNATGTPAVVYAFNKAPATPAASYSLNMQDDGNLVWSDNTGNIVWSVTPVPPLYTLTSPSAQYNSVMNAGSTLNGDCNSFGCGIQSPSGKYLAIMQHDCIFAIYTSDIKTQLYKTNTYQGGQPTCFLAAQTNGQLAVYETVNGASTSLLVLNPNTPAKTDTYTLTLGNDGNLIWADSKGNPVWSALPIVVQTATAVPTATISAAPSTVPTVAPSSLYNITNPSVYFVTTMQSGTTLNNDCKSGGCFLASPSFQFKAFMQADCKFVLYSTNPYTSVYAQNTWQGAGHTCYLAAQTNGQIVIYRADPGVPPRALWTSNPAPAVPAASYTLTLQENGSLQWADNTGNVLWSSPNQVVYTPNTLQQPAACPAKPFLPDQRSVCPGNTTTYEQCYSAGCCWDQPPNGVFAINCYISTSNVWFGTPGSDPGVTTPVTVANPGQYDLLTTGPVTPLGIAPIPTTNEVLLLERIAYGWWSVYHSYSFNPVTLAFTPKHPYTDIFCSGGVMLSDGSVLNIGGWTGGPSLRGIRFISPHGDWRQDVSVMQLQKPRWYPSALLLPNGQAWAVGGSPDATAGTNEPTVEILPNFNNDPIITVQLLVNTKGANLYPFVYYIPADANQASSSIFLLADYQSQLFDPKTFAPRDSLPNIPFKGPNTEGRSYPYSGSSVMLPLVADKNNQNPPMQIMICGGSDGTTGLDTCVTTTPSLGANAVWQMETMPIPRVLGDLVALPDQTVLYINGATLGKAGFGLGKAAALNPVLYTPSAPAGSRFTVLNATSVARLYHSEAMLMLDGRVLVIGSTPNQDSMDDPTLTVHINEKKIEAFSPPYLLNGAAAPQILSVQASTWNYNTAYTITATIPSGNTSGVTVSLINPGFSNY
ncbi:hypothetical protein HK103_007166 [Boothiomyces macroporosus]|uniref:Bulb-type lectin domain-containing protein n=1 Tax=Boothiomyces macroporosus TaxID=261099 RepID=A0AAD5Y6I7_9FUNG|nr:hypothetical protein HK103_007166 [Boothiomyces macroporosus]